MNEDGTKMKENIVDGSVSFVPDVITPDENEADRPALAREGEDPGFNEQDSEFEPGEIVALAPETPKSSTKPQ